MNKKLIFAIILIPISYFAGCYMTKEGAISDAAYLTIRLMQDTCEQASYAPVNCQMLQERIMTKLHQSDEEFEAK